MIKVAASQGFFFAYELQQRGWRLGTIATFFPNPSKVGSGGNPETGLYREELVLQVESTPEFHVVQAEQERLSTKSLDQEIEDGPSSQLPTVPMMNRKRLRDSAIVLQNTRQFADPRRVPLVLPASQAAKIELDYLVAHVGTPMKSDARSQARSLMAIALRYPHLWRECEARLKGIDSSRSHCLRNEIDAFLTEGVDTNGNTPPSLGT